MFPSPSPGLPSHPRARHYRRYLEVVLLAMLRVYLLSTPRVVRYRGRSPARMRPGDSPGPRRPFVGSGWTRTDRVERVLLAGRARARSLARSCPLRRLGRSGTHWRGPPPWAPAADGSPERLPQRHGTRSLSSLRDASASNGLASDCRRQPPLAASGRFQRARPVASRGVPAAPGPLPPVPAPTQSRPEDCQSGVSTPRLRQYPNTRCRCPRRASD